MYLLTYRSTKDLQTFTSYRLCKFPSQNHSPKIKTLYVCTYTSSHSELERVASPTETCRLLFLSLFFLPSTSTINNITGLTPSPSLSFPQSLVNERTNKQTTRQQTELPAIRNHGVQIARSLCAITSPAIFKHPPTTSPFTAAVVASW